MAVVGLVCVIVWKVVWWYCSGSAVSGQDHGRTLQRIERHALHQLLQTLGDRPERRIAQRAQDGADNADKQDAAVKAFLDKASDMTVPRPI